MCFVFKSVATKFVNHYAILFCSFLLFLTIQTELKEEAISDGFLLESQVLAVDVISSVSGVASMIILALLTHLKV